MENDFIVFKIIFLGESGVGKTSILTRYFNNNFDTNSKSTIGVDTFQNIKITKETKIHYCYWDTAGQDRFKSIISSYYQNVDGVVIVYDVTDKKTFDSIDYWYNIVKENDPVVFIVGNKCESNNREISKDLEKDIMEKYKCFFIEVSAKSGDKIIELFNNIQKNVFFKKKHKFDDNEIEIEILKNNKNIENNQNFNKCCI